MSDESLRRQLSDLRAELRAEKRINTTIDIKFMSLIRVLEKIVYAETRDQAIQMATSILKQTSIDHTSTKVTLPAPSEKPLEPAQTIVPHTHPTPQKKRRGPKTKDSKESKASLGDFF